MHNRRETYLAGEMIRHSANGNLTLPVGLLVDGRCNCSLFEVRGHFHEKISSDELDLAAETSCTQGPAHREAVYGVYIDASQSRNPTQQIESLLEALVLVFVTFNYCGNPAPRAMLRKSLLEAIGFLAMILRH